MIRYFQKNKDWHLQRGTLGAAGYDLRADIGTPRIIDAGERWLVSTGLHTAFPSFINAEIRSRSGLAINHGIIVLNAPGTIDSDYRGEIKVSLINLGQQPFEILPGDRIGQIVFCPVLPDYHEYLRGGGGMFAWCEVVRVPNFESLGDTARGSGGHGSTGR